MFAGSKNCSEGRDVTTAPCAVPVLELLPNGTPARSSALPVPARASTGQAPSLHQPAWSDSEAGLSSHLGKVPDSAENSSEHSEQKRARSKSRHRREVSQGRSEVEKKEDKAGGKVPGQSRRISVGMPELRLQRFSRGWSH